MLEFNAPRVILIDAYSAIVVSRRKAFRASDYGSNKVLSHIPEIDIAYLNLKSTVESIQYKDPR